MQRMIRTSASILVLSAIVVGFLLLSQGAAEAATGSPASTVASTCRKSSFRLRRCRHAVAPTGAPTAAPASTPAVTTPVTAPVTTAPVTTAPVTTAPVTTAPVTVAGPVVPVEPTTQPTTAPTAAQPVVTVAAPVAPVVAPPAPVVVPVPTVVQGPLPGVGVNVHAFWQDSSTYPAELDALKAAGVSWVRTDLAWSNVEAAGPGITQAWYLSRIDTYLKAADARGIKVLFIILASPGWANGGQPTTTGPTDPAQYGRIAGWLADRYKGRVAAWELWNEPNRTEYFTGADAVSYVRLAAAAYPAIKLADPATKVVAGAVSAVDFAWIDAAYDAGLGAFCDVISIHPYQGKADNAPETPTDGTPWLLSSVPKVHDVMVRHGDAAKPLWFTEFGWSDHANTAATPLWERGVDQQQQAAYLVGTLRMAQAQFPYVTVAFWYNARNRTDADDFTNNLGLLGTDLTPKPAYYALQALLTGPHS